VKIQIKNRWSLAILFEHDAEENTMKLTIEAAAKAKVDLRSANLRSANLSGADLSGADLSVADLSGANLRSANLRSANLSGADLSGADLSVADLSGADLSGADLSGANLRSAYLSVADLQPIRADFYDVLSHAGKEVPALIDALKNGRVDGSTYTGQCACLVGTIANVRGVDYSSLEHNASRPIERFFAGISEGDTPETNQASRIAVEWAESWLAMQREAFAA
jgi:hypothetical protein